MRRTLIRFGLIALLIVAVLGIVSCKEKDTNNYTNMGTNFFSIQDGKYIATVSNATDTLDLTSCLYFSENASWEVSKNQDFSEIADKNVALECGDNTFFIRVTDKNSNVQTYALRVHRNNLYKVTFNTDGGSECKEQTVEEGFFASSPDSVKPGYTLAWDFDFTTPITSDTTVNAVWTAKKYKVTLDAPATSIDKTVIDVEFGKDYTIPDAEKDGYRFLGWQVSGSTLDATGKWGITSDVVATAIFTKINYGINYVLDLEGTANSEDNPSVYTIEDGFTLTDPSCPERAIFMGWYLKDGTKVTEISKGTTGEITLYAKWRIQYTVTFDANGTDIDGTELKVFLGEDYILPKPSKNDYEFSGWQYNGANVSLTGKWSINSDVTLTAVFEPKTHDILYVLNGGTNAAGNPSSYTVESNRIVLLDPEKDGFVFDGWYTTADYETKVTEIDTGAGVEIVLHAKWLKKYSVTLDAVGGTLDVSSLEVIYGKDYSLPTPERTGYIFSGWKYNGVTVEESGTWNIDSAEKNITLTTSWTPKVYTITYVLYGGINNASNPVSYTPDDEAIILADPTNGVYLFKGWYLSNGFEESEKVTEIASGSVTDIVIYAKWESEEESFVYYDANGGAMSQDHQTITKGAEYSLLIPERVGYTFNGWYNGDTKIENSGTWNISGNVTLTASWTITDYNISYDLGGGTSTNPLTYNVETETFTLAVPVREGYDFVGWTGTDIVGTVETVTVYQGTTKDREYTAVWFKKTATNGVIYDYKNGKAVVTGYVGSFSGSGFTIPSVYEGYSVVAIEEGAFMGLGSKLTSAQPFYVNIPDSINYIGKNAFKDCIGFAPVISYISGEREEERNARIENWISALIIESGNDQVIDVIRNKCPMIGNGNYV